MSSTRIGNKRSRNTLTAIFLPLLLLLAAESTVRAGGLNIRQNNVGGISVNAGGIVNQPNVQGRERLRAMLLDGLKPIPEGLNDVVSLRKVSLRGLQSAVDEALRNGTGKLPDEVRYLAGLHRIQYVLVYPELNDIVLAGPGEGWTIDDQANVVGITTGQPVLQLDDLLVALRTVTAARDVGISCSIDPTDEGRRQLESLLAGFTRYQPQVLSQIEQALGPQSITITGVPKDSHFARVLVAADYRMKRIAMDLDPSPVRGLPNYLDMVKTGAVSKDMMPRWWLACHYEPLARSDNGLAWELRGPGVKCMTENDFVSEDGSVETTGQTSSTAQRWADLMTEKYEELSSRDLVFAELRNLMDLCVVAALLEKEQLVDKAGFNLSLLSESGNRLMVDTWNIPRTVATQASVVKKGRNYIISASGGVQIESWQIASQAEDSKHVGSIHAQSVAPPDAAAWWWNGS